MPLGHLEAFGKKFVSDVRDEAASTILPRLLGEYGQDHAFAKLWRRADSEEHRREILYALLTMIDGTLTQLMFFLEGKMRSEITVILRSGEREYEVSGADMLPAWYDFVVSEYTKATVEALMKGAG